MKLQFRTRKVSKTCNKKQFNFTKFIDMGFVYIIFYAPFFSLVIVTKKTPSFRVLKYRFKTFFNQIWKDFVFSYKMSFDQNEYFVMIESSDCDHCVSTNFTKFNSFKALYNWENDPNEWDWVEGRVCVEIISEEEFLHFTQNPVKNRDLILEAHENGHSHMVIY